MTEQEAIAALKLTGESMDKEQAHQDADSVLLNFLADDGYDDIANAFIAADDNCGGFWYA